MNTLDKAPRYIAALKNEYESRVGFGNVPRSIYIGGGTPNALSAGQLDALLSIFDFAARRGREAYLDFEYTVELNPELVTEDKVRILEMHGVNRASLGVQSTNDAVLKSIGRRHLYSDAVRSAEFLVGCGITNISFDFITGFAGQTAADADEFVSLAERYAHHASVYSLEYSGTKIPVLDEDSERDLFEYMREKLRRAGFERYEVSSFAKRGFESRHNSSYWFMEKYIGLGTAAASYDGVCRSVNAPDLDKYIEFYSKKTEAPCAENNSVSNVTPLTDYDRMVEGLVLPLRTVRGVDVRRFERDFGIDLSALEAVKTLLQRGVLILDGSALVFSDRGFDISNSAYVMIIDEIDRSFVN